jgi:threonine synthase
VSDVGVRLRCSGCSTVVDPLDPLTGGATAGFRCPNIARAPRIDHVLVWEPHINGVTEWPNDPNINPFIRYRTLHHAYWLARAHGWTDQQYIDRVGRVDQAIAAVDGHGFTITPFDICDNATEVLGVRIWAKDETGNVAGSHKARHLMGLAMHLEVEKVPVTKPLGIASCGNAALAASVIAKAVRRKIEVFVPEGANPVVLSRLSELGATVSVCERSPSSPPGDPTMNMFHAALNRGPLRGVLPFCVQGNENGLTIDGGTTLGQELVDQLSVVGLTPSRMFIHCGGGAFATSVMRGLGHGVHLGMIGSIPPLHIVQPDACAPLRRAWAAVANRALQALGVDDLRADGSDYEDEAMDAEVAARLTQSDAWEAVANALQFAVSNRASHMWPWDFNGDFNGDLDEGNALPSVAGGIIDDETYDWFALVGAMICTGGWPVVVDNDLLLEANEISGSAADETGTAGLAGVIALRRAQLIADDENVVCIFSGIRR